MDKDRKRKRINRKKGTQTSAFGVPGRIGHDSSRFYRGKLYEGLTEQRKVSYVESEIDPSVLNNIFCKSSEPRPKTVYTAPYLHHTRCGRSRLFDEGGNHMG